MFIKLLNNVPVGNFDDNVEKLLKERSIEESDENYLKDAFNMYAENEPATKKNDVVLNGLPGELYTMPKFQIIVITHCQQFKVFWIKNKNQRFRKCFLGKAFYKIDINS